MPQNASKNYEYPLGTRGIPDETIESAAYNTFLDDLVNEDLNIPRPIHRGGTGANNADQALFNLNAAKAAQIVTNYDNHVWVPGSFRSSNATGQNAPVDGHAFAGIVYINEPLTSPPTNLNVIVEARDQNDTQAPGRVYIREKKAGVWGPWVVDDVSTMPFPPSGTLEATTVLAAIQELDTEKAAITYVDDEVAGLKTYVDTEDDTLQDNIDALRLYVDEEKIDKDGDTMVGALTLFGDPTEILHAATKQYVDRTISETMNLILGTGELLFMRSLNQHMTRLFTNSSSNAWTMSMWVKRSSFGTHQGLFGITTGGNQLHIGFHADNGASFFAGPDGSTGAPGAPPHTDPTKWLNMVWSCQSGDPAGGRFHNLQINNHAPWALTILTTAPLNTAVTHYIGQPGFFPDVVMKDVVFVDGSIVPPTSFGQDVGGVWTPKSYTGPFGPNGFKLNFANRTAPASTNLGKDISGNNNHWVAMNF